MRLYHCGIIASAKKSAMISSMAYDIVFPILLTFVPWLVVRYVFATEHSRTVSYRTTAPYLWGASALWFIGGFLPTIPMAETDSFQLHMTGGMAACVLFFFAVKTYRVRFTEWWQEPLFLYFFVSGLGVANELLELLLNKTSILAVSVHQNDTWWDFLANNLGAAIAFGCVLIYRWLRPKR
jgi:hypothetical protein